jgi:hypothetical protein
MSVRVGVDGCGRIGRSVVRAAHPVLGPLVAVGELVIGIALILGLFTGIAAFLGSILNFSFAFAGSTGVNPAMLLVSGALILAWRNAGWYGLDRWVLPAVGTPWHRGERIDAQILERNSAPARSAGRSSSTTRRRLTAVLLCCRSRPGPPPGRSNGHDLTRPAPSGGGVA